MWMGRGGDKVWCIGEDIVWGEDNSEVPPQMIHPSVHHVNSLHFTLGTCQALTQRDWLSSPAPWKTICGESLVIMRGRGTQGNFYLARVKMGIENSNTLKSYQTKLSTGAHNPIGKSM